MRGYNLNFLKFTFYLYNSICKKSMFSSIPGHYPIQTIQWLYRISEKCEQFLSRTIDSKCVQLNLNELSEL